MGVSINDNNGGGSVTQTTNTSSSSLNCQSHSNHDGHDHSNNSNNYYDQNNNGCGRKSCMNQSNFNAALSTIKKQNFEDTAIKTAKQVISVNCPNVDQIIKIDNIFKFEENKLDFAKYAYDFCIEPKIYFKLNGIFTFSTNADELSDYVQSRR